MTQNAVPYLAGVDWYRAWLQSRIKGLKPSASDEAPNRGLIRGAWGIQTLTVPIEGGRKRMARIPYTRLRLSEHDDWRHKHRHAITSAYGALPYFSYFIDEICAPFATATTLAELNGGLHESLVKCAGLENLADWIRLHPETPLPACRPSEVPGNLSALELLFLYGPETIFHLL